ncbi:hypothetical protein A1355_10340 [Methylomonas koyamae]|uniref:Uncharacterized protein n=1 Tax=Methylomonas koyamae TaxID=702114 RepID=A0A177NG16_9GAMM|nr:hypothetical protein A1355_10340 [Methylomonas koyamae]
MGELPVRNRQLAGPVPRAASNADSIRVWLNLAVGNAAIFRRFWPKHPSSARQNPVRSTPYSAKIAG